MHVFCMHGVGGNADVIFFYAIFIYITSFRYENASVMCIYFVSEHREQGNSFVYFVSDTVLVLSLPLVL